MFIASSLVVSRTRARGENAGALEQLPVGGVAGEDGVDVGGKRRERRLGAIDHMHAEALSLSALRRRLADLAGADDEHRRRACLAVAAAAR